MEYTVITGDVTGFSESKGLLKFIEKVNGKLSEGWECQGDFKMSRDIHSYAQAMIKK